MQPAPPGNRPVGNGHSQLPQQPFVQRHLGKSTHHRNPCKSRQQPWHPVHRGHRRKPQTRPSRIKRVNQRETRDSILSARNNSDGLEGRQTADRIAHQMNRLIPRFESDEIGIPFRQIPNRYDVVIDSNPRRRQAENRSVGQDKINQPIKCGIAPLSRRNKIQRRFRPPRRNGLHSTRPERLHESLPASPVCSTISETRASMLDA